MYHHPGEYVTDFCIVKRDKLFHLFHIRGERWTWPVGYRELDLGHATSTDLRTWTPHDPVLPAGSHGAWDECGNWAPDIIEVDGTYYCYYTGSDSNNNQAIGLATSTDLFHWEKHAANPVVVPGAWSDRAVGKDVAGRDAMVFADTSFADTGFADTGFADTGFADTGFADTAHKRYLLYYTATTADGRACLAVSQSTDLVNWQDLGPTYSEEDRSYNRLESAYLVANGGRYYLFYSAKGGPKSKGSSPTAYPHFDIVYQIGETPLGPWHKPSNHELLTEATCASEHPTFDNTTYMLYIIQEEIAGIWGSSVLSDPKRIAWQADGTVQIHEHLPAAVKRQPLFVGATDGFGEWVQQDGHWIADEAGGLAVHALGNSFFMNTRWGTDLSWEGDVQLAENSVASLIVRGNPSAMAGYRISVDQAEGTVALYQQFPAQPDQLIQARPVQLSKGKWHKLKVVVQGGFLDIYVDNILLIVRHHELYREGCFGLHACGTVRFRELTAYQTVDENRQADDWCSHCRPRHLFRDRVGE